MICWLMVGEIGCVVHLELFYCSFAVELFGENHKLCHKVLAGCNFIPTAPLEERTSLVKILQNRAFILFSIFRNISSLVIG